MPPFPLDLSILLPTQLHPSVSFGKKVSRKTRGALSSSTGGARGGRIGGSQFAADRRPGVSHVMTAYLPVGGVAQTFGGGGGGGGAVVAIATAGSAAGRQPEDSRVKVMLQAGAAGGSTARRETGGGQDCRGVGGRDFCVAVSGGLASVLELVQPLRHIEWAGRDPGTPAVAVAPHGAGKKREVLRMARVPPTWRRAEIGVAVDGRKDGAHDHNDVTAAAVEDVDGEAEEFMVMCDDGWVGWYQSHHRRFEVS